MSSKESDPVHAGVQDQVRAIRLCLAWDLATVLPVAAVALLSNSLLLLADILDYGKSLTTSLIAWFILRRILRRQVAEYDYGPGKLEVFGGLVAATVMCAGLAVLAVFSVRRLLAPEPVHPGFASLGLLVNAIGLAVNAWLWRRNRRLARRERSPLLDVQWRVNRADALVCAGVLAVLGIILAAPDRPWSVYVDPVCSLLFLGYAAVSFLGMMRRFLDDLLDRTLDESVQLTILRRLAEHYEGYETFHGVRSRRAGPRTFVDISLGFSPDKTVGEVLDTVQRLRADLEGDIPGSEVNVILKPMERPALSRLEKTPVQILPLSRATLAQALALIRETLPILPGEAPELELEESVEPGRHAARLAERGMSDPRYWVAFTKGRVIGVAGFYFKAEDRQEAVWGGWTTYDARVRTGLSRARFLLLQKLAIEAHATGRKFFRLYTETCPEEAQANHFYDRMGIKVYRTEPAPGGQHLRLYRQADLAALFKAGVEDVS